MLKLLKNSIAQAFCLIVIVEWLVSDSYAWINFYTHTTTTKSALNAKKLNRQTDLRRKLELAKEQKKYEHSKSGKEENQLSPQSIKERNDRLRFEELLRQSSALPEDFSSDGYLTREQEEEEISAARASVDRIFEGDPAPVDCFEELVSIKSENVVGKTGIKSIVPWLHKNTARHDDYLVIMSDPRLKSPEFRQTIQNLQVDLPPDVYSRIIFINADSPAENRRWIKKASLQDKVDLFSDEKLQWMRSYTALGKIRWSMTMFVLQNGVVRKLAREVDLYGATHTISKAVSSLSEARLK